MAWASNLAAINEDISTSIECNLGKLDRYIWRNIDIRLSHDTDKYIIMNDKIKISSYIYCSTVSSSYDY